MPSINLSNTKRKILGNVENLTCGWWVRSLFATSELWSPSYKHNVCWQYLSQMKDRLLCIRKTYISWRKKQANIWYLQRHLQLFKPHSTGSSSLRKCNFIHLRTSTKKMEEKNINFNEPSEQQQQQRRQPLPAFPRTWMTFDIIFVSFLLKLKLQIKALFSSRSKSERVKKI